MSAENQKKAGLALAILGGLVAIGLTIFVTHDAAYLWALLLLAIGLNRVRRQTKQSLYVGAIMGLLYVAVGVVVFYVKEGAYLWAMLLVSVLADKIL